MKSVKKIIAIALSVIIAINLSAFYVSAYETEKPISARTMGSIFFSDYGIEKSFENCLCFENGYKLWVSNKNNDYLTYKDGYYFLENISSDETVQFKISLPENAQNISIPHLYLNGEYADFNKNLSYTNTFQFRSVYENVYAELVFDDWGIIGFPSKSASLYYNLDSDTISGHLYSESFPLSVKKINGISYDKDTNTLTLNNVSEKNMSLTAHEMGAGFTVELIGENHLTAIRAFAGKHYASLTIKGNGSLYLNENKKKKCTALYVDGNFTNSYLYIAPDTNVKAYAADSNQTPVDIKSTLLENAMLINDRASVYTYSEAVQTTDNKCYSHFYLYSEFDNLTPGHECEHDFIGGKCIYCKLGGCYVGDTNLDGRISINDATSTQEYLADFIKLDRIGEHAADINMDGEISVIDVTLTQRYLADLYKI